MPVEVFVDEGKRAGYLLCAAVVASQDVARARRAMRALNRRRLHMHSEGAASRQRILARFAQAPPISAAHLWRLPIQGRSERAARDECFRALIPGVLELGAARIVVESCAQDQQDKAVIGSSLAQAGALGQLEFRVVPAQSDELLWAADLVRWAYLAGGRSQRAVADLVTVHNLP